MLLNIFVFSAWIKVIHMMTMTNNAFHDLKTSPFNIFQIINTIEGPT
jgi:hypothetical protein